MTIVWALDMPATQKIVLLALADNANDEGDCYPSVRTLVAKCGLSERAIQSVISKHQDAGHLHCNFRTGRSTIYKLHPRTTCTPAPPAPPQLVHPTPAAGAPPPPHQVHPTPAPRAPITVIEPSVESSSNRKSNTQACRLPQSFELTEERRKVAIGERIDPDRTFAKFCDHWKSASGARARKSDWDATWRNWCRTDADRSQPKRDANGVQW